MTKGDASSGEVRNLNVPGPTPDDDKILDPPPGDGEDPGTKEAVSLGRGRPEKELKKEAATREHDRSQKFKDHFERIAICYLWAAAIVLFLAGLSLGWHFLAPERCQPRDDTI